MEISRYHSFAPNLYWEATSSFTKPLVDNVRTPFDDVPRAYPYHERSGTGWSLIRGGSCLLALCHSVGRCQNGSWFNHVLEWWEAAQADPEHVLFLHYESMLKEPEENIRKITDFAGIEYTPETIAKVCERHKICFLSMLWSAATHPLKSFDQPISEG